VRFRHHPMQEYGAGSVAALMAALKMWEEQGK
jgi:hypothetical protein